MKDLDILTKEIIEKLVSRGAEIATCTAASGEEREFNIDGGEFSLFRTLFDNSLTMSAVIGKKRGSVGTNSFEPEAVEKAIDDCIAAANSSNPDDAWGLCPDATEAHFTCGPLEAELDLLFDRTKELMDTVKTEFPKIVMEQMIVSHGSSHSVYRNSNGAHIVKDSGDYSVDLMFSGHDGDVASSFFGSGFATDDLSVPFIDRASVRVDLENIEKQIHTVPAEGKFVGTVVFSPSCFEEFLGSIADNFASDGVILQDTSIWKDKLGEKVADERLTVSFAPHSVGMVGGQSYTGEGFLTKDFDFIKNGVLESFILSLYVANKTGRKRSENGGSNMVVAPGDKTLDELVASIDRGILVGRFSGGEPTTNGDFSGVAKNSFFIENGKITTAPAEIMISGNMADMLKNLRGITKERVANGSSVIPYAAFDGITVSGK